MIPQHFLDAIIAQPGDDNIRLVVCDWLEENAGEVACERCGGSGAPEVPRQIRGDMHTVARCAACDGEGRVSNGYGERAEFIRVQCELAGLECHMPSNGMRESGSGNALSCWQCRPRNKRDCLPWCRNCQRRDDLQKRERELWPIVRSGYRSELGKDWAVHAEGVVPSLVAPVEKSAVVSRGFVAECHLPLAAFMGRKCQTCDGDGCHACGLRDTGCIKALGPQIARTQPVERWVIVGAEPYPIIAHDAWAWFNEYEVAGRNGGDTLPKEIYALLNGFSAGGNLAKHYPSRELALAAISDACVAYCRHRNSPAAHAPAAN